MPETGALPESHKGPWYNATASRLFHPSLATESVLPDSNLLAVFYGFIIKLISPAPLSVWLPVRLFSRQNFIADMSLSLSLYPFLSVLVSSVFYSCCNSHLTFLLGDYFIMRPQLPPSLSPTCSPPFPSPLIAVHVPFLFFQITFITSVIWETTV